jgi:hypothetical protein
MYACQEMSRIMSITTVPARLEDSLANKAAHAKLVQLDDQRAALAARATSIKARLKIRGGHVDAFALALLADNDAKALDLRHAAEELRTLERQIRFLNRALEMKASEIEHKKHKLLTK